MMRCAAIAILAAIGLSGCGSDSKTAETKSAGIPLSISGSNQAKPPENATKLPTIEQYAQAVQQLIQRANTAVNSGKYSTAIESLSQAIGITAEDASLFRMRADVYALQGENANARADFSTAVRLSPSDPDLYNYRGYFLMSQGLNGEARADFDKAVELNPRHTAALNNRGLMTLAVQSFKEAEADFTRAIESDRKSADAWNNRGFARMKMEQYDAALKDIKQAIQLNENYVTAWNNCGLIAMQQKKYDEAEAAFSRAVELAPMDSRWLNHRRAARIKLNRFADAQRDAQTIEWLNEFNLLTQQASRNARDPEAWMLRGRHLMKGEHFEAAIQDFSRAISVKPGNPDALFARAVAWVKTGDIQKAMVDCDESLVTRPTQEAYSLRGDLWSRMENWDQAIEDFESARRFDEQVAVAYEMRSEKNRQAGDAAAAEADAAKSREIREAMLDKPGQPKTTNITAEAFDPDSSNQ
jgi:tetratricopeptide (TPR) repeat protein